MMGLTRCWTEASKRVVQETWQHCGQIALVVIYLLTTAFAVAHTLVFKANSVSATAWIVFVLVLPFVGPLLYWLLGINRIAGKTDQRLRWSEQGALPAIALPQIQDEPALCRVGRVIAGTELSSGHSVRPLLNGEDAFADMLAAIESAQTEVLLATYIFDDDHTGRRFVGALAAARERGVRVLVMLDDLGRRTSFPGILPRLLGANLDVTRFMPIQLMPPKFSVNLRNHRKMLLVDQRVGFAGGMNIGDRQLSRTDEPRRAVDVHFAIQGPVIADLRALFVSDWLRCGGADPGARPWEPVVCGSAFCRLVPDGPDEQLDHLALLLIGVISAAQRRVVIVTPYFLPDRRLQGALQAAALRGVQVQVMIPQRCNWPFVRWALNHNLWEMLTAGVEIWEQPGTFAHSKCLLIDDEYVLIGSANLDPRSLRLNFELGIEVFDQVFSIQMHGYVEPLIERSRPVLLEDMSGRSFVVRLRDATAALFAPYL